MKCVFAWLPNEKLKSFFLKNLPKEVNAIFVNKSDKEKLQTEFENAAIIVGWQLSVELLKNANELKYILYPGAGVQHISDDLIQFFKQRNIIFCNSHGNAFATAQHAVALLLTLSNRVVQHHNFMLNGNWRTGDKEAKSISLYNKNVGLLGFGKVGQHVFKMLSGFNCNFLVYKNDDEIAAEFKQHTTLYSSKKQNLVAFLKNCEILICTLPSTKLTANIINKGNIKHLKKDCLIVNVGRGNVIEEAAFFNFLKSNENAAAAIDVWYNYKPEEENGKKFPFNFKFNRLPNVVLSPHRGASPMDDPFRYQPIIDNLYECVKATPSLKNVINFEKGY